MNANWWHVCRTPKALFGTFGHMSNDHSTAIITVHDSTVCSNNNMWVSYFKTRFSLQMSNKNDKLGGFFHIKQNW